MHMNLKDVKQILGRTEVLGLDTQPIRDLIKKIQSREVTCSEFEHILRTLDKTISTNGFSNNSKPVQVELLLKQVSKKLKEPRVVPGDYPTVGKSEDFSESVNMEILNIVSKLSQDLKTIKEQKPQQVIVEKVPTQAKEQKQDQNAPSLSGAFVSPLIGQKDQKYKSNISIESKEGDNIGDKLSKLKKLKNKNG